MLVNAATKITRSFCIINKLKGNTRMAEVGQ
jgi:hypothetical protein